MAFSKLPVAERELTLTRLFDAPRPLVFLGDRAALQAWLDGWAGPVSWSMSDLAVEVGFDVAVAYGTAHLMGIRTDGADIDLRIRMTMGLRRRGSAWLITHQHLSTHPEILRRG